MNKNIVEIEIGDKKIGFKFCFASYAIFCEMNDVGLQELTQKLMKKLDLYSVRDLMYSGHKAYCQSQGIECEITPADVEGWIEEMGIVSTAYKSLMDAWSHSFTSLFFGSNNLTVSKESSKKKKAVKKNPKTQKDTQ